LTRPRFIAAPLWRNSPRSLPISRWLGRWLGDRTATRPPNL